MNKLELFRTANKVNWRDEWLICNECKVWLTPPIHTHDNMKYYCNDCQVIKENGDSRNEPLEEMISKCSNDGCFMWSDVKRLLGHLKICRHVENNCFICKKTFSGHDEWELHYVQDHEDSYTKIDSTSPSPKPIYKMQIINTHKDQCQVFIAEYKTHRFFIVVHVRNDQIAIGVGKTSQDFDKETSKHFKLKVCFDNETYKKCSGEYVGLKQLFSNKSDYHVIGMTKWTTASIKIIFNKFNKITNIADCPICLNTLAIMVPCKNGHQVCSECAAKITSCPICRAQISYIRLKISDIMPNLLTTCTYADKGCLQLGNACQMDYHAKYCNHRPIDCPECHQTLSKVQVRDHLKMEHADCYSNNVHVDWTSDVYVSYSVCNDSLFRCWHVFDHQSKLFITHIKVIYTNSTLLDDKFGFCIQWQQFDESADVIKYSHVPFRGTLEFVNGLKDYTWAPCHHCETPLVVSVIIYPILNICTCSSLLDRSRSIYCHKSECRHKTHNCYDCLKIKHHM